MSLEVKRPGAIAAGVGVAYAIKEGASIPFPNGRYVDLGAYLAGILGGELYRRYQDNKLEPFGLSKFALSAVGIWGINRGIEPQVLFNFAAGTGITAAAVGLSEKAGDLYDRHKENAAERKKRRAEKKKDKDKEENDS